MKKATPNHTNVPSWDTATSESYIQKCCRDYQKKFSEMYSIKGHYFGPNSCQYYSSVKQHYSSVRADWIFINDLFLEGRTSKVLNCDFEQFAENLIYGYQRKWIRYSRLETPFRHKHENTKWKDKDKKTISEKEQIRRDWRKIKGSNRDYRKVSWRRSAGKWFKNHSNKLHRSWERKNINNNNWDALRNERKIKFFQDPWMWD